MIRPGLGHVLATGVDRAGRQGVADWGGHVDGRRDLHHVAGWDVAPCSDVGRDVIAVLLRLCRPPQHPLARDVDECLVPAVAMEREPVLLHQAQREVLRPPARRRAKAEGQRLGRQRPVEEELDDVPCRDVLDVERLAPRHRRDERHRAALHRGGARLVEGVDHRRRHRVKRPCSQQRVALLGPSDRGDVEAEERVRHREAEDVRIEGLGCPTQHIAGEERARGDLPPIAQRARRVDGP